MADVTVILPATGLNIVLPESTINIKTWASFSRGFTTGFPVPVDIVVPVEPVSIDINLIEPILKAGVTVEAEPISVVISMPGIGSQVVHASAIQITLNLPPLAGIGYGTTIPWKVIVYLTEEIANDKIIVTDILTGHYIKEAISKEKFITEEIVTEEIIEEEIEL